MDMKSEAGLGLAIHWLQQALFSVYYDNCSLRPIKMGRQSLKWTTELESLRKGVRWLFNKCRSGKDPHSWDLYRKAQRNYRKEVRKAFRDAWRAFCIPLMTYPSQLDCIGLFLGTLTSSWALWWLLQEGEQSEGETLELLLTTHFPDSGVTQELAAPAAALTAKRPDWRLATRVVTYKKGRMGH
jgi:hypothetical protein